MFLEKTEFGRAFGGAQEENGVEKRDGGGCFGGNVSRGNESGRALDGGQGEKGSTQVIGQERRPVESMSGLQQPLPSAQQEFVTTTSSDNRGVSQLPTRLITRQSPPFLAGNQLYDWYTHRRGFCC